MRPPFDPIIVEFFPGFAIHWYGVLIVLGIVAGAYYAAWRAKQDGENPDHIWNGLTVAIILAIVGARIYHVFSEPAEGLGRSYYFDPSHPEHLIEIFYIWKGGLGIYGAAAGGALGVLLYARYARLRPLQWLDYGAPALVLGQAIGRWGNFFNQELYGPPTGSSWWGLIIDDQHRIGPYNCVALGDPDCVPGKQVYSLDTLFHPAFLYESLWCLLVFVVLAVIAHKWKKKLLPGDIVWGYLIGYPLGRFFIEHFFRPDAWMLGSMAAAQWFAIACVVGGATALVVRHVLARRAASAEVCGEVSGEVAGELSGEEAEETAEAADVIVDTEPEAGEAGGPESET
jgi:phosphatidylglycerol:prolipoprotein diacylglycerol transferase